MGISGTYAYAGGYNTVIPTVDEKAGVSLQVEFSRAPDKFFLNKYTQLQPVEIESGKYVRLDQNAMARINTADGGQFVWADGARRPAANIFQGFDMPAYNCVRFNFGFELGDLATYHAKKASGLDLTAVNSRTAAGAAMVQRTRKALAALSDTKVMPWINMQTVDWTTIGQATPTGFGNLSPMWTSATAPTGLVATHYWDAGTNPNAGSANNVHSGTSYLRTGVNSIVAMICAQSNGQVKPKDINCIIGPDTAIALAQSSEILDFIKQSTIAGVNLNQDDQFNQYGIPSRMFGVEWIVEDASYISAYPMGGVGSPVRSWCVPAGTIIFASRPGSIEGSAQSYATCMGFFLEEMTVETFDEPKDRLTQGNVVENYDYEIVAPITGCVLQHAITGT